MMLIAAAGILMGLALFGVLIVQAAALWSAGVRARAQGVVSKLAASSGLEYSVARLWQESGRPDAIVPGTAADDWAARETAADESGPLARSRNPSWARGDRWTDADADGKYDPAVDALAAELDDNGSVDAATARLRGRGTMGLGFSARVRAATGLVCVNSGELGALTGDQDLDGILNGTDADYDTNVDGGPDDWQDPDFIGNAHLVNLLANLGAIAGVSTTRTDSYHADVPATDAVNGIEFMTSDLGRQIVSARPRGGYLSLWQVEQAVGSDDYAKVAPYLSTLGDIVPVSFPDTTKASLLWNAATSPEARYEFHARIDLNNAPHDVLKAALRYLSASGTYRSAGAGVAVVETPFVRLQKDEADAIAERIASARPICTWKRLLEVLADPAIPDDGSVFMDDPFCPATLAEHGPARRRLKEDLILAQADANGYWMDPASRHRNSLEVSREGTVVGFDATRIRNIPNGALAGDLVSAPYGADGVATTTIADYVSGIPDRRTTEWSLAGSVPGAFVVSCEGWARRAGGMPASAARGAAEIRVTGQIVLTGQQDFERLPRSLADPAATTDRWDSPGGEIWTDTCAQARAGVQSAPRFPFTTGSVNPDTGVPTLNFTPDPAGWPASEYRYPAAIGDLRLSTYQSSPAERGASGGPGTPLFTLTFGENWTEYGEPENTSWLDNIGDPIDRGAFEPLPLRCDTTQPLPAGAAAFYQGFRFGSSGGGFAAPGTSPGSASGNSSGPMALAISAVASPASMMLRSEWRDPASVPFVMGTFGGPDDGGGLAGEAKSDAIRLAGLSAGSVGAGAGTGATPAGPTLGSGQFGEICAGTLELIVPSSGGDAAVSGMAEGQIALKYRSGTTAAGQPIYTEYATFYFYNTGQVGVGTTISFTSPTTGTVAVHLNPAPRRFPAAGNPLVATAGTGFHHVALALEDHPTEEDASRVTIYIDGVEVGRTPVRFHPSRPPQGGMVIDAQWPFDDFLLYPETLDQPTIERHARQARFATDALSPGNATGAYRSAWLNVDPARFPDGVKIRALTFDTFIPSKTGGRFAFEVVTNTGSGSAAWDWDAWKTGGAAPRAAFDLPRARSVQLRISVGAHDDDPTGENRWTDIWPRVGGEATLRDTPILDEVVVHYADRPRWMDCRLR